MTDIPAASTAGSRIDRMRAVTRRGHGGQTRNGGRLPYWVHTDGVADICRQALLATGELPADAAEDLILAAYGHDLYEDTGVSTAEIRSEFGPRVDGWIGGMTNRNGDHDRGEYLRHLAAAPDEVRIIKCADLIDNMLSVAYGLHDLGLDWVYGFFLPIATETRAVLQSTPFERLARTGAYLLPLVEWAWHRLEGSIETATTIPAGPAQSGDGMSDGTTGDSELSPEAQALIAARTWTDEQWAESQAEVDAENEERGRKLFGDGERFFIPDTETDS
ncbi:MAG TPA: hypothetical protein VGF84_01060 [Micromonosporaceae bacterium]|jgi:hypothetical protein